MSGSDSAAMRSSVGRAKTSRQPGRPSRMAPCSKLSRNCMVWGRVNATTVAPRSAAAEPAASWLHVAVGVHGRDPQHVPVDGAVGQERHGGQEIDLLFAEAVQATGNDELDRRALVVPHGRGEAFHLGPAGGAGGDGAAVAVVVRVDLGGREAERPLGQGGVQGRLHGVEVRRRGVAAHGALAHHQPAQGRVPDQEARVRPRPAPPTGPATLRTTSSPRAVRPAARRAASPRPAPSSGRCSRPRPERAERARSRSFRRGPWSHRAAGTGWRPGPRTAGRRSGCGGRRSPVRPACPGRR